ncbi:ATP-binding protein [Amycolatopsis sp. lyj-90]|uniref:ATP-binding protein n=1 Tax=Amycolatopsis sp. lyj-90 TaxID=2789285 RepID=UPI00397B2E26
MTSSDAAIRQDTTTRELAMTGDVRRLAEVRAWTRETLDGLPEDTVADVVMVVDELASNALRHARAPYLVRLLHTDDTLRVEVSDGAPGSAARRGPPNSTGGQGLTLVSLASTSWGQTARPDGKTVWAELDIGQADG